MKNSPIAKLYPQQPLSETVQADRLAVPASASGPSPSAKYCLYAMGASALVELGMSLFRYGSRLHSIEWVLVGVLHLILGATLAFTTVKSLLKSNLPMRRRLCVFNATGMLSTLLCTRIFSYLVKLGASSGHLVEVALYIAAVGSLMFVICGTLFSPLGIMWEMLEARRGRIVTLGCGRQHIAKK